MRSQKKSTKKSTTKPLVIAAHSIPPVGKYWPGQGGVNCGIVRGRDGGKDYFLILATEDSAKFTDAEYGPTGVTVPGADDHYDGAKNTAALVKAGGHALAEKIAALKIDGHQDFYLPARFESALLYANVRDLIENAWHHTSTQYSANLAWYQHFFTGHQGWYRKNDKGRARAVRRVFIHSVL